MPDLRHPEPPIGLAHLDDDIDEQVQQGPNVFPRQIAAPLGFADQQRQLLKGQGRAVGVDGRDRAGVAGVDVAKIFGKSLFETPGPDKNRGGRSRSAGRRD